MPPPPLLPRVALGDPLAVRACIERYGGLVWSLARRMSDGESDAEDGAQEAFVEIWRAASRFDPAKGEEVTFVAMLARRRLLDRARARRRRPGTSTLEEEALPPSMPRGEASAEVALAGRALAGLREDPRKVLLMATVDGLTHEEISEALQMPLGTVKTHVRRALATVRAFLEGPPPGAEESER